MALPDGTEKVVHHAIRYGIGRGPDIADQAAFAGIVDGSGVASAAASLTKNAFAAASGRRTGALVPANRTYRPSRRGDARPVERGAN